jgi:hypothetical protein
MHQSPRLPGALPRSRGALAAATALLLIVAAGVWATVALALPPGGPAEKRAGATILIKNRVVQPAGSTTPLPTGVTQPVGLVEFSGAGFTPNELVQVKIDDGAVRPDPALRPAPPAGGAPNSDDWFLALEADGDGNIAGQVDLSDVLAADASALTSGKHLLRFVSTYPRATPTNGRSIHADFAISNAVPRANLVNGGRITLGPGPDVPVAETPAREYDGIPKLVPGSLIPYVISGLDANQTYNLRLNDATFLVQNATADADGRASGLIAVPDAVTQNAVNWIRLLTGTPSGTSRSIAAVYALAPTPTPRAVTVGATAQRGRGVQLTGSGLLKEPFYVTGNPADGQTVTARLDGTGTPFDLRAGADGTLSGELPIPAGTSLGTHKVLLYIGFRAGSDFPQAVYERSFEVTEFVPDPVVTTPTETTPVVTTPTTTTPTTTTPVTPPATTPKPRAAKVASTKLRATKTGRISLSIARPSVTTKATVSVKTKSKVRAPGARKKTIVTLVKAKSLTLKAGTAKGRTTVSLTLTKTARALLKRSGSLKVVVRVTPKGGKAFTRTLNLRG